MVILKGVQLQLFAIEGAIGILVDPVAEHNHAVAGLSNGVERHMQVPEYEEMGLGMFAGILVDKCLEMADTLFHTLVDLLLRAARAVVGTPAMSERESPSRMHRGIEGLAHLIIKAPSGEAVHARLMPHIVAMREQEVLAHDVD